MITHNRQRLANEAILVVFSPDDHPEAVCIRFETPHQSHTFTFPNRDLPQIASTLKRHYRWAQSVLDRQSNAKQVVSPELGIDAKAKEG